MLVVELVLLAIGFGVHLWLHIARPSKFWAVSRLLAELNRSVRSLGQLHVYLEYLFRLGLPPNYVPLLRTLNFLHLRATRRQRSTNWEEQRNDYLKVRLDDPDWREGQIAYYRRAFIRERRLLMASNVLFLAFSGQAILATVIKLIGHCPWMDFGEFPGAPYREILGIGTIWLPVLAVGCLSWAAARDFEARVNTFHDMWKFLKIQRDVIAETQAAEEFREAVMETEFRLLSEVAQWYSRRMHAGVA
jgi:hypothetical protein